MSPEEALVTLDTPDAFKTWLLSKQPGDKVGTTRCNGNCPVAQYLVAMGQNHVDVGPGYIMCGPGTSTLDRTRRDHAKWSKAFISAVDAIPYIDGVGPPAVSAATALHTLEVVLRPQVPVVLA